MTIAYKGRDKRSRYRVAEISFKDEEESLMDLMREILEYRGYQVDIVDNMAIVEVEDMNEYNELKSDYMESRRLAKQQLRSRR